LRELGFVSGQGFTFGTYTFSIRAVDHAGNVSESYSYEPITAYLNLDGSFTSLAKPTIEATSIGYLLANYTLFTSAKATFDLSKNTISSPGGAALTYTIQISDSARFNTENTYEFETAETSFVLDGSTIGKGSGMLCNMDQVYWRVKVTDANGVCTDWKNGETFAFRDENGLKIVNQYFKPDFIISTSISDIVPDFEGTGDNTHYKFLSWEGGEEEGFGIKYYLVTVKDSAGTVTEFASTDVYNGENGWIVKDIPHEGECTWTVKSVNYQGLTSNTFTGGKFVYDVTAPVFDTKSVKGECYGSVVDISWNAATDNI